MFYLPAYLGVLVICFRQVFVCCCLSKCSECVSLRGEGGRSVFIKQGRPTFPRRLMDASQGTNIPYMGPPASSISVSDGKRKRRPTTFAGFLTSDRQLDNLITGKQAPSSSTPGMTGGGTGIELAAVAAVAAGTSNNNQNYQEFGITVGGPVAAGAARTIPSKQHRSAAAAGTARVRTQQNVTAPKAEHGETPPPGGRASVPSHPNVKKVVGVQNATRKALEWLQHGDLTLLDLAQSLPKLSKARVEIVMEALRAAGLVTLVRKHAPNAMVRLPMIPL